MSTFQSYFPKDLSTLPVEEQWDEFASAILTTLQNNVPHKVTSSRYNLPWFTSSHRRLCRKKQKLYNRAKTSNRPEDWANFKVTRRALHKALSKSRDQYTSEFLVDACKTSPKGFWSHIKKVRNKEVGVADWRSVASCSLMRELRPKP